MLSVGMGAVYTRTSLRRVLRADDTARDAALVARYFDPYAEALADLVDQRLAATGRAVIIDLHSYPADALPYELHADLFRPAICLGTDARHTPEALIAAAEAACAHLGDVVRDEPFLGTYVPMRHFGTDTRVWSIMVEIRRDTYCSADGSLAPGWREVADALAEFAGLACGLLFGRTAP